MAKAVNDVPETDWKVHVCSENNFPTAAGLASSAAGYACLGRYGLIYLRTGRDLLVNETVNTFIEKSN